jgi:hypothetical protein
MNKIMELIAEYKLRQKSLRQTKGIHNEEKHIKSKQAIYKTKSFENGR